MIPDRFQEIKERKSKEKGPPIMHVPLNNVEVLLFVIIVTKATYFMQATS